MNNMISDVHLIKSLKVFGVDKRSQLLDAYLLGYMVGVCNEKPDILDELKREIITVNKKLKKGEMNLEDKNNYYNTIISKEQQRLSKIFNSQINNPIKLAYLEKVVPSNTNLNEEVNKQVQQKQNRLQNHSHQISQQYQQQGLQQQKQQKQSQISLEYQSQAQQNIQFKMQEPSYLEPQSFAKSIISQKEIKQCTICFENLKPNESYQLQLCKHTFHKECLIEYGKSQKQLPLRCPQVECQFEFIQIDLNMICDNETKKKLDEASFKNYQMRARDLVVCPTVDCPGIYVVECIERLGVIDCFVCKRRHCIKCKQLEHQGLCEAGQSFIRIAKEKGYQKCKRCGIFVEKNQGCNHMRCPCGNQFCYLCGNAWQSNGYYCFCESNLELKLAKFVGLVSDQYQPYGPVRTIEEQLQKEVSIGVDDFLKNVIRYFGRQERRLNKRER